jgi:hypothetical protein
MRHQSRLARRLLPAAIGCSAPVLLCSDAHLPLCCPPLLALPAEGSGSQLLMHVLYMHQSWACCPHARLPPWSALNCEVKKVSCILRSNVQGSV